MLLKTRQERILQKSEQEIQPTNRSEKNTPPKKLEVLCFYFETKCNLQSLAEMAYFYTPQVAIREPAFLVLEISKTAHLFYHKSIPARLQLEFEKLNLRFRSALASDVPCSLSLAYFSKKHKNELPLEALFFYAAVFKEDLLVQKNLNSLLLKLKSLGLQNLADFQNLKNSELAWRFGKQAVQWQQRVSDASNLLWPPFVLEEIVEERFDFDPEFPVWNLESIFFQLKNLLEKIYFRLRAQGKRLKALLFDFYFEYAGLAEAAFIEKKATEKKAAEKKTNPLNSLQLLDEAAKQAAKKHSIEISLSSLPLSSKAIFNIVREKLNEAVRLKPLQSPVKAFALRVQESLPFYETQLDLLNPQKEKNAEKLQLLLTRVQAKLGPTAFFLAQAQASYLPEFNSLKLRLDQLDLNHLHLKHNANSAETEKKERQLILKHCPQRPLRLLTPALLLEMNEQELLWEGRRHRIISLNRHELIQSEWWQGLSERHYFRVITDTAYDLWIFKSQEQFFLHGFFD